MISNSILLRFKFGECIRGAYYDDHATIRVQEMAKLKSNRMLVTKTKVELAVVRPGMLTENGEDSTVRTDEDRLKLLDVLMTQKVKGKSIN